MIKARASGSKVYLYLMKKGRQARHRIPRNSCLLLESDFTHKDHSVSVLSSTLITGVPIRAVLCSVISFPFRSISIPIESHDL